MVANMDIDEDDDLYVPEEPKAQEATPDDRPKADDLEEGEEEDEGAAMDEDDDDSVGTLRFFTTCAFSHAIIGY